MWEIIQSNPLATYGSILATASFAWNLATYYRQRSKLVVSIRNKDITQRSSKIRADAIMIMNIGRSKTSVLSVEFYASKIGQGIDYGRDKIDILTDEEKNSVLPYPLDAHESFEILLKKMNEDARLNGKTLRVVVHSSDGRSYISIVK